MLYGIHFTLLLCCSLLFILPGSQNRWKKYQSIIGVELIYAPELMLFHYKICSYVCTFVLLRFIVVLLMHSVSVHVWSILLKFFLHTLSLSKWNLAQTMSSLHFSERSTNEIDDIIFHLFIVYFCYLTKVLTSDCLGLPILHL